MALVQLKIICFIVLGDKIHDQSTRCYYVEYGGKILHWLEQFIDIGNVLHKMDTGRSSIAT
jgi:hypothetical protein